MDNENIDFDISSYNRSELFSLFDINIFNSNYNPQNMKENLELLKKKYNEKIHSLDKTENIDLKQNLTHFFTEAYRKLSEKLSREIIELFEKENQQMKKRENEKITVESIQKEHPMPVVKQQKYTPIMNIKYPFGKLNPIEKKTTKKIVSIDTLFRKNYRKCPSCNFTYDLPTPIENVISMKLLSAEVPNSDYLFSSKNNNNYFKIIMNNNGKKHELKSVVNPTLWLLCEP